jgi:hypothetical protein
VSEVCEVEPGSCWYAWMWRWRHEALVLHVERCHPGWIATPDRPADYWPHRPLPWIAATLRELNAEAKAARTSRA